MRWGRPVVLVGAAIGAIAACSSGSGASAPLGKGDTLVVDVEASTLPQQPDPADDPDSAFARVDGSDIYGSGYDASAYALMTICEPPDGSAEASTTKSSDASTGSTTAEGGANATEDAGCQPLPAACTSQPDCACILTALATMLPCPYPHCGVDHGFHLYCPP
jgi:hypothetical protein